MRVRLVVLKFKNALAVAIKQTIINSVGSGCSISDREVLPKPCGPGSNPAISNFYKEHLFTVNYIQ